MAVHGKNFVILACVMLTQYRRVTEEWTDRRTPRCAKHYTLSRVKIV